MQPRKTYEDLYNVERLITRRRITGVSNDIDHKVAMSRSMPVAKCLQGIVYNKNYLTDLREKTDFLLIKHNNHNSHPSIITWLVSK